MCICNSYLSIYLYLKREFYQVSETDVEWFSSNINPYASPAAMSQMQPKLGHTGLHWKRPLTSKSILYWYLHYRDKSWWKNNLYILVNADNITSVCCFVWAAGSPSVIFPAKNKSCSSKHLMFYHHLLQVKILDCTIMSYTSEKMLEGCSNTPTIPISLPRFLV